MTNVVLPGPQEPVIDKQTGLMREPWYRYFSQEGTVLTSTVSGIAESVSDFVSKFAKSPSLSLTVCTANTTFLTNARTAYAFVIATGGGGGGGGAGSSGGFAYGGGGEAGGTFIKLFSLVQLGTAAVVTIGSGGTAGSTVGGDGGDGGDTVIDPSGTGATLTALGGDGGNGIVATSLAAIFTGAAGSGESGATNGDLNFAGQEGGLPPDGGGSSFWGGGGKVSAVLASGISVAGRPATAFGSGGAGAYTNTATGSSGGAGTPGVAMFLEFLSATTT